MQTFGNDSRRVPAADQPADSFDALCFGGGDGTACGEADDGNLVHFSLPGFDGLTGFAGTNVSAPVVPGSVRAGLRAEPARPSMRQCG